MTSTSRPSSNAPTDNVDLSQVAGVLRRRWLPLLLAPLLVGGATYALSSRQPPTYRSSASLMAAPTDLGGALGQVSVAASSLPQGAVEQVLRSRSMVEGILSRVEASSLPSSVKSEIASDMKRELSSGSYARLQVRARLDGQQRGTYELQSAAETPGAARVLADAAASSLLDWDLGRIKSSVSLARVNLQQQLQELNRRIADAAPGSAEQAALQTARAELVLSLSQATVLERSARGNLTLLAEANAPSRPVSPRPLRNAALAAVIALFGAVGVALLLDALRRKVNSASDLTQLGLPVLGELPYLSGLKRNQTVGSVRSGKLYEPTGFIRVNISAAVPTVPAIVAMTSARPGEGKSSAVAATATAYALAGKRVLVVDLDLHRPMQQELWSVQGCPVVALGNNTEVQVATVTEAIRAPRVAGALDVGNGIHLLPAGQGGRHAAEILSNPSFPGLLKQWARNYDLVLLDTPPIRAVADALSIAKQADGLVLVVESRETPVPDLERAIQDVNSTGVRLIGVILNKVRLGEQGYYSYAYAAAD